MATVRDVITGAYGRLSLLPLGATLDPDRAAVGLTVFNDIVNELMLEGIAPSGPPAPIAQYPEPVQNNFIPHGPSNSITPLADNPVTYTLASAFPYPSFFVNGFKSLLAAQLADDAGVEAGNVTIRGAAKCKEAMLAYYVTAPLSNFDQAITKTPSHRPWRGDTAITDFINDV